MPRLRPMRLVILALFLALPPGARAEPGSKTRILLLGDSTCIGSVCRQTNPQGPHLEDVIRLLLAAEPDLPSAEVINQGRDGEFIHRLFTSGRYEQEIAKIPDVDYILIRYGLNDLGKREDFAVNFPKDFTALIDRLRHDFPGAVIVPMTIIPYISPEKDESINRLVRQVAEAEKLPFLDIYTRYSAELKHGPDMLNYRRFPIEKVPEKYRDLVKPFVRGDRVVVMDNTLDVHFRDLRGWFSDRHPNLAGYHVIGAETARFLAQQMRQRSKAARASGESQPRQEPGR